MTPTATFRKIPAGWLLLAVVVMSATSLCVVPQVAAFSVSLHGGNHYRQSSGTIRSNRQATPSLQRLSLYAANDPNNHASEPLTRTATPNTSLTTTRRSALQKSLSLFATGLVTLTGSTASANAAQLDNRLFSPNPLTNPVLEQLRIWDQAAADNLKYDGELERGDAGNNGQVSAYPKLLVPILQIADQLDQVQRLILRDNASAQEQTQAWTEAAELLAQKSYFSKQEFKRLFNAFGDNIYFADPDRANLYLGGGATPKSEQSMAYLLRNDILTSVEDLQAELAYLLQPSTTEPDDDLKAYAAAANKAMQAYLRLVPPAEIRAARSLLLDSTPTTTPTTTTTL